MCKNDARADVCQGSSCPRRKWATLHLVPSATMTIQSLEIMSLFEVDITSWAKSTQRTFTATTPSVIPTPMKRMRNWGDAFCTFAMAKGICVHPHDLIARGHGEPRGFDFGDDLPNALFGCLDTWSAEILGALSCHKTFPESSVARKIVPHFSDGCEALFNIITPRHPRFVAVPIRKVMNFPEAKANANYL